MATDQETQRPASPIGNPSPSRVSSTPNTENRTPGTILLPPSEPTCLCVYLCRWHGRQVAARRQARSPATRRLPASSSRGTRGPVCPPMRQGCQGRKTQIAGVTPKPPPRTGKPRGGYGVGMQRRGGTWSSWPQAKPLWGVVAAQLVTKRSSPRIPPGTCLRSRRARLQLSSKGLAGAVSQESHGKSRLGGYSRRVGGVRRRALARSRELWQGQTGALSVWRVRPFSGGAR